MERSLQGREQNVSHALLERLTGQVMSWCQVVCEGHLLYEVPEEDGLLPQGIVNQALREEDHPVGEVVLREPRHHALLLHIRAACDVDDQIAQVLPVPACKTHSIKQASEGINSDQWY